MPEKPVDILFENTYKKLLKVSRKFFSLKGLRYILVFLFYILTTLLVFVFFDFLIRLNYPYRLGFWIITISLASYLFIRYALPNIKKLIKPGREDLFNISRLIGKENDEVSDALIDFLQIYFDDSIHSHPVFKNLSLKQLYGKFKNSDFQSILSLRILREPALRLLSISTIFLFLFVIFPQSMSNAVLNVLNPLKAKEYTQPFRLINTSGDLTVLKNEKVELKGVYEQLQPHKLWVVIQSNVGNDSTSMEKFEVQIAAGNQFSYVLNHVKDSFSYWFVGNSARGDVFGDKPVASEKGIVTVKERPYIRNLKIKLSYPAYTKLPDLWLPSNQGEINELIGTRVLLNVEANKRLSTAKIVFADSSAKPLMVVENRASGEFTVTRDDQYRIIIQDADSIPNYQPIQYSIFALGDEKPFVEIAKPGQDLDLGDELSLPLLINLRDDFGFSRLSLKGRVIHAGSNGDTSEFHIKLPIQYLDRGKAISEPLWDLSPFYLVPEDYIEYYAEVADNDRVTGPKIARSKMYVLRLPSIMEILEESDEALTEQLEDTEELTRESKELREKLEEISREMKREKELSWERKKEIQEQLGKQDEMLNKLDDIQKELEDVVNQLDDQKTLSPETMEKYFELQEMLKDLATPELMEAMNKLKEALEKADLEQVKKSLDEFRLSLEDFEKSIERTYELFKRIELEKQMDELVKLAEKITEEQKEINKKLDENNSTADKEQLAAKENDLEKQTDFLKEKIAETQENYKEINQKESDDLNDAEKFIDEQQIPGEMNKMEQQLSQGEMQKAQKKGKKVQQQMEMLQSMLQQAKQNMNKMQKQEVMEEMQKVTQDMLRASYKQEKLYQQSNRTDMASSQVNDIARKQVQLQEDSENIIGQLIDISKKTFFISPQMNQVMADMMKNMQQAVGNLENRETRRAAQSQQKAMGNLNRGIMSLQNSMNQLMQASSASGMDEMMQQLQQMSGQQGQLNQESMSLLQQQAQSGMQLSEDALARLAAQQEMIRQSLESLNQQMGSREDVLGRLGELGQEMEEVIKELQKRQLDRKVIERQQKILSRMLDAQKSIREKEYSKKRQAEREKKIVVKSPPELRNEILNRESILQKELIQSLKEGYSSEYKDYIKLYYEILSRQTVGSEKF